ncbi:ArsR family transcriptional regulator [Bradymonas sediminis]|nr:ArsR family transcriptional regulator [Bradymonas sediminis]
MSTGVFYSWPPRHRVAKPHSFETIEMHGYTYRDSPEDDIDFPALDRWEALAINAVGRVIEFWGFKRNHGHAWCLLYLRGEPMSAADLQRELGLSKGAVSMISRDLEAWGVAHRVQVPQSKVRHFVAEVDFLQMLRRVIQARELSLVVRVRDDLKDALYFAREQEVDPARLKRVRGMLRLADMMTDALSFFLKTLHLDFSEADDLLEDTGDTAPSA